MFYFLHHQKSLLLRHESGLKTDDGSEGHVTMSLLVSPFNSFLLKTKTIYIENLLLTSPESTKGDAGVNFVIKQISHLQ